MPSHTESRIVPFTPQQIYDLVMDVERYPEFLPWCSAARITRRAPGELDADLMIGFRMIRERFSSRVKHDPEALTIQVQYLAGPLRYLNSRWAFTAEPGGACRIQFAIDFEFRSRLLERLMAALFEEVVYRMVSGFERRAHALHGRRSGSTVPAAAVAGPKAAV